MQQGSGPTIQPTRRALRRRPIRASAGVDAESLDRFYRDYFLPLVWRATYKHGLAKEDARDVVQEAFILAMTKLRADGNPRAWLNQVVDHLSVSHNRKKNRRAYLTVKWGFGGTTAGDPWPTKENDE